MGLALMEEAAGTKLYDLKRAQAEKKIANKEARVGQGATNVVKESACCCSYDFACQQSLSQ